MFSPINAEKLERVAQYAGLRDGLSVLDVGSGKGAVLRQWAGRWNIHGTGLEINPAFVQEARAQAQAEGVAQRLTFWEGDAKQFGEADNYDVVACLGATFALGSFAQALNWMHGRLKSGGVMIVGEVYLKTKLSAGELASEGWDDLPTLAQRCADFEAAGVELTGLVTSSTGDWDHYSSLMWSAVSRWQTEQSSHPHRAEVVQRVRAGRKKYLRWEREHLGWAVLVGRKQP